MNAPMVGQASLLEAQAGTRAIGPVLVVVATTFLYFGLRVYDNYAATGTIHMATWIVGKFPHTRGLYHWASLLLEAPLVILNSLAVAVTLASFLRRGLWKYALWVGVLSELAWVWLWRAYIWERDWSSLTSSWAVAESCVFAAGPPLVACWVEALVRRRSGESSRSHKPTEQGAGG